MKNTINCITKKILSLILVVALLISSNPVMTAQAATDDEYVVLEVKSQTNLKRDSYADSNTICTAYPGELLLAVDAVTNRYDNVWYQLVVSDPDAGNVSKAFAYSGDVVLHECEFDAFSTDEGEVTVTYCRCGKIQIQEEGISSQNSVALNPTGMLSPEDTEAILSAVAAAKAYVKVAGVSASKAISALTSPILLVPIIVSGFVVTVVAACDGKTVTIEHVKSNYKKYSDSDMKDGNYYCALVLPDTKIVMFMSIPGTEMDIDAAAAFMTTVAGFSNDYMLGSKGNRELFGNIYTPNFTDAERLCKKLVKAGLFEYGGDKGVGTALSVDKNKIPGTELYRHYHLHYTAGFFSSLFTQNHKFVSKVPGSHIFWGAPVGIRQAS